MYLKILRYPCYINYRARIRLGVYKTSQDNGFQEIDSIKLVKHEHFKPSPKYENDIGLVKIPGLAESKSVRRIN